MTEKIIAKVLCSKPEPKSHTIGRVIATEDGLVLEVVRPVYGPGDLTAEALAERVPVARTVVERFPRDPTVGADAYCTNCKKVYPIVSIERIIAAASGAKNIYLDADGLLRDPIGVSDRSQRRTR
jgi:hypothetical protein